ncbi:ABC transporter permease [Dyadobacter arcticus]|uniref:ABC transport system permease protein n=1 Tax=Dyadobacter arcticus TaxID=1078754 RepID=A0ABX0UMH9_9BACT|nr:ABC transporter permease [Dyadobacter arcticus]NIJ54214.1 putative ABC transport system permease protein [Dyadobacter arcticus]
MLKNYLKLAFRNLVKDKFYSLINILGLTIGVTCGMLLFLYVSDELSYDRYHEKADRIYRIVSYIREPDKINKWTSTQPPLVKTLKQDYPFVESYVRFFGRGRTMFKLGEKRFYEEDVYSTDSTIFDIFTYKFLEGDPKIALDEPGSVVLTEKVAKRFFGQENALGQILRTDDTTSYKVTGVIKDVPKNSHMTFNALMSLDANQRNADGWGGFYINSYLLLAKNADIKKLEAGFPGLYEKYMSSIFKRMGIHITYQMQPLTSIHLYSKFDGETNGDIGYVYTFSAIAFFMLLIASINYMNLATAQSARRTKEVGLRKVMGSLKGALIAQFLTESVLITMISLVSSLILVAALLSFFNTVSGKEIGYMELLSPKFIIIGLSIVAFTGLISGSYPAFYLSAFEPADVLKGSFKARGGSFFRKALVVTQFSISMVMLICTWIVYQQLNYMRNKDMGYDRDQVLTIDFQGEQPKARYNAFRKDLLDNPNVKSVASASSPVSNIGGRVIFTVESSTGMKEMAFKPTLVDHEYVKTMGMKLLQGRNFSDELPADTANSVMINEAVVKRMNWKDPIGKKIMLGTVPADGKNPPPTALVVGVVKDFHQQSLYNPIEPLIMIYRRANPVIHVKVSTKNTKETMAYIGQKWQQAYPARLFEYRFLDQDFQSAYRADELRGQIFTAFSALTILIACLGLFGLATFTTEQRVKEIGVRKVLGGSVSSVVMLLSKDFTKLVLFSFPIAIPIAYFSMDRWLQGFPFKTDISPWIFVAACALTLVICWLTVIYQSLKAALANPVKSLRSE